MEKLVTIRNLFCKQEGVELPLQSEEVVILQKKALRKRSAIPIAIADGRRFRRVFDKNKFRF